MDLSTLDFGTVPDYLPTFTILGGIIIGVRELRKDLAEKRAERQRQIDLAEKEAQAQELAAAQVAGRLLPPQFDNGDIGNGMAAEFENYGPYPVFDVKVDLSYTGQAEVPDELRRFRKAVAVLPSGKSFAILAALKKWPKAHYDEEDFDWYLTFRDLRGESWRRNKFGVPIKIPSA